MRLTRRARGEAGFTLVTVVGAMAVVAILTVSAFAAVNGDLRESGKDVARKQALAAAEAGVNAYLLGLNANNDYWSQCADPVGVTNPRAGTSVAPEWVSVPGAATKYTIELLPANGYATCVKGSGDSVIDANTRSLRIRVTGQAPSAKGPVTRSLIVSFKRDSFLDFLYFTDFETSDPVWYAVNTNGYPTRTSSTNPTDAPTWAAANCPSYYRNPPAGGSDVGYKRATRSWDGQYQDSTGTWRSFPGSISCAEIVFAPNDVIAGPLHTNDELLICGKPTFGRNSQDRIESGNGWRGSSSCSGNSPNIQGTLLAGNTIGLPATNASLQSVAAQGGLTFSGRTTIQFGTAPGKITVTNNNLNPKTQSFSYPGNGVIYVANSGTCPAYSALHPSYSATSDPLRPDTTNCGDALIKGSYDTSLTIATANDIVVTGDVLEASGSDTLLGLIADNFVRVEHDSSNLAKVNPDNSVPTSPATDPTCTNDATAGARTIDAAILTLRHSFIVDRYYCGSPLGNLTINGVVAQKFRGAVGKNSGGSIKNGYVKAYSYDNRLAFRSPPHFLDPVKSAWHIHRYTEQTPAAL
jgi:type II secretory pathway pseudopilin PulG